MGPGMESMMTQQALQALETADVIVGYPVYLELLGERFVSCLTNSILFHINFKMSIQVQITGSPEDLVYRVYHFHL